MKNILVIRFTALGDVALTVPVIESLAESHPQYNITVITQPQFAPLFEFMPENVTFIGVNHKEYNGLGGAKRLYKKITSEHKIDAVADLHGKLRTLLLGIMFKLHFVKVSVVRKERRKRNQLIRLHGKKLEQLTPITEIYVKTFNRLGIDFDIHFKSIYPEIKGNIKEINQIVGEKNGKWIGVAPFASSEGKILPAPTMEKVVEGLSKRGYRIFIFAFGEKELAVVVYDCAAGRAAVQICIAVRVIVARCIQAGDVLLHGVLNAAALCAYPVEHTDDAGLAFRVALLDS